MNTTNPLSNSNEWLYSVLNLDGYDEDSKSDFFSELDFFSDETDSTGTSTTTSQSPSTESSPLSSPDSYYQERSVANIQQATNSLMLSGILQVNASVLSSAPNAAQEAHQKRSSKRAERKYKPYKAEKLQNSDKQLKIQKRLDKNREAAQASRDRKKAELTTLQNQDQQLQNLTPRLEELVAQYRQTFYWSTLKPETQITDPIARIHQIVETVILEAIANQDAFEVEKQKLINPLKQ